MSLFLSVFCRRVSHVLSDSQTLSLLVTVCGRLYRHGRALSRGVAVMFAALAEMFDVLVEILEVLVDMLEVFVEILDVLVEILEVLVEMLLVFVETSPDTSKISAALIAPVTVMLAAFVSVTPDT